MGGTNTSESVSYGRDSDVRVQVQRDFAVLVHSHACTGAVAVLVVYIKTHHMLLRDRSIQVVGLRVIVYLVLENSATLTYALI